MGPLLLAIYDNKCLIICIVTESSCLVNWKESEEMRSNSLDSKLKAKEVELKRHEQEIADQDEVWYLCL